MKKTEKLLSALLMIAMVVTSVGLLYTSIFASAGGGIQSSLSSVVFERESGIRYNTLTEEFEVFNAAGVSWIASNRYISVDGTVAPSGASGLGSDYGYADGNKTYNIMRDIAFDASLSGETFYNSSFDTSKIKLGATGILDGRGFNLKDFEVVAVSLTTSQGNKTVGSAIVSLNEGTIRNLNVSNPSFQSGSSAVAAGIICGINMGKIDSCATYGAGDNVYSSNRYTGLYGIAAMNNSTIINSVNNVNIQNNYNSSSSYAAGIAGVEDFGVDPSEAPDTIIFYNNTNNGNISSTNGRAAGVAIASTEARFKARGNVNNGNLSAGIGVSGIIDGGAELTYLTAKTNVNNGSISDTGNNFPLYFGITDSSDVVNPPPPPPKYGIRYNPTLKNGTSGGFEILNMDGISWVASGAWFNDKQEKADDASAGEDFKQATNTSYYKIVASGENPEIDYNSRSADGIFNTAFYGGSYGQAPSIITQVYGPSGEFDGNNVLLKNFPVRRCGPSLNYYSAFFYQISATVRNVNMLINAPNVVVHSQSAFVGGIAGSMFTALNTYYGLLYDCVVSGVMSCILEGQPTAKGGVVGGLVGIMTENQTGFGSMVERSKVEGLQISGYDVGGIVGKSVSGGSLSVKNITGFYFVGKISAERYAGGFAGYGEGLRLVNNLNYTVSADITGQTNGAGILVGYLLSDSNTYDGTTLGSFEGSTINGIPYTNQYYGTYKFIYDI